MARDRTDRRRCASVAPRNNATRNPIANSRLRICTRERKTRVRTSDFHDPSGSSYFRGYPRQTRVPPSGDPSRRNRTVPLCRCVGTPTLAPDEPHEAPPTRTGALEIVWRLIRTQWNSPARRGSPARQATGKTHHNGRGRQGNNNRHPLVTPSEHWPGNNCPHHLH